MRLPSPRSETCPRRMDKADRWTSHPLTSLVQAKRRLAWPCLRQELKQFPQGLGPVECENWPGARLRIETARKTGFEDGLPRHAGDQAQGAKGRSFFRNL